MPGEKGLKGQPGDIGFEGKKVCKDWRMFKYYGSTESECYEAQFDFHAGGYYKQL